MLNEIATPDRAEPWLKDALAQKKKIMGFGHRVYKKGDSRVPIMREIARDYGKRVGKENWVPICENLSFSFGYDFILWTNVVRPGKQLNRSVDTRQAPTDINFNGTEGRLVGQRNRLDWIR